MASDQIAICPFPYREQLNFLLIYSFNATTILYVKIGHYRAEHDPLVRKWFKLLKLLTVKMLVAKYRARFEIEIG